MKKLFVLRHSKSSWKDISLSDFHRPLNKRGKIDGQMMSKYLCDRIDKIDFLHCSSSVRTHETSKFFIDEINYDQIKYDKSLYHTSSSALIINIKNYKEKYNSAMLIAHNPALTDLINEITNISIDNFPTTGLIEIDFNSAMWSGISSKNCNVIDIKFPKQLK